jgi:hypothetical protein
MVRVIYSAFGSYFKKRLNFERCHYCGCGKLEKVEHILSDCALRLTERNYLGKVFPKLDL